MNISAIDLGFLYTKAIINGKPIIMKSVVGNSKPQRFADLNMGLKDDVDNLQCRVGMEDYFVSDLAIDQSDTTYHSLKDDRFNGEATEVLVKTALALGFQGDHVTTNVVSGLPVSHYANYKDNISKLFLNKIHNFEVHDHGRLIKGSVKVEGGKFIPQPFGALLDKVLDKDGGIADKALAGKTVAVIDPGFGTTDVYVADALAPVERLTFSTKTAMNHSYGLIANKIEEQFDVLLPLHQIEKIVRKGEFRKSGKVYPMQQIVQWAYKATAQQLVAEVTNKWKTIHEIDHILLAGGGGLALSKFILPEFSNIELLENSQWSVVNGYYKWGVRQFG
jgi:plasmid segregation protein ParM